MWKGDKDIQLYLVSTGVRLQDLLPGPDSKDMDVFTGPAHVRREVTDDT